MIAETDYPHLTVACVVKKNNTFLMVHEHTDHGQRINQPAGHVEVGETVIEAAVRETLEETRWHVKVTQVVGLSHYAAPNGVTYVRVTFAAEAIEEDTTATLDDGIIEALWMSLDELQSQQEKLRSPLVLQDILRYEQGIQFPLSLFSN